MAYLYASRSPFGMYGIGYVAQRGHDLGPQPQLAVERHAAAVDRGIGQSGHADAAAGDAHVIILEFLRRAEILAHGLERRRADRAVTQRHRAELVGREEFRLLQILIHFYILYNYFSNATTRAVNI